MPTERLCLRCSGLMVDATPPFDKAKYGGSYVWKCSTCGTYGYDRACISCGRKFWPTSDLDKVCSQCPEPEVLPIPEPDPLVSDDYHSGGTFKRLGTAQNWHCFYCKKPLQRGKIHVDHMTPKRWGGSHNIDNLCLACVRCNLRKGDKTAQEFIDWLIWMGELIVY